MRWRKLLPVLLLGPGYALAAAPTAPAAGIANGLSGQLAQLGLGLLVVLGLIFMLGYVMRRVGPLAPQGGQHIRLISSYPLGPRDRLALVEVGGQQLLLGISPGRITTLHKLDAPVDENATDTAGGDFARKLQAMLKREQKP